MSRQICTYAEGKLMGKKATVYIILELKKKLRVCGRQLYFHFKCLCFTVNDG